MSTTKFIIERVQFEEKEIQNYRNEIKLRINFLNDMIDKNADAKWLEGEIEAMAQACKDIRTAEAKIEAMKLVLGNMQL